MKVTFYGVRGSVASPGEKTAKTGGNTSCVGLECGGQRIILDAGTGLRDLGAAMLASGAPLEATVLLSHYHWDHIQGLPFFVPLYMKGTKLEVVGGANGIMGVRDTLTHQMSSPVFPVAFSDIGAEIDAREVKPGDSFMTGEVRVVVAKLNHPGGVYAYRIEWNGKVLVYATDTEHYACTDPVLRKLSEGADVLIYDSQYTPEEYPQKVGWGHSTFVAGAELAKAAGVGKLVLFHHDPSRSDAGVADIELRARELFPNCIAAREGASFGVGERPLSGVKAA